MAPPAGAMLEGVVCLVVVTYQAIQGLAIAESRYDIGPFISLLPRDAKFFRLVLYDAVIYPSGNTAVVGGNTYTLPGGNLPDHWDMYVAKLNPSGQVEWIEEKYFEIVY